MGKIVILSGAGLSAESGIPTFRDSNGLWEQHKTEEVCYLPNFLPFYIKSNDFYDARRKQLAKVEPNAAHLAIADLQKQGYDVINITTNVDDLLERAGCTDVMHLHGILTEVVRKWNTPDAYIEYVGYGNSDYNNMDLMPTKPNVVFFHENAPLYQKMYDTFADLSSEDVAIVVGSSENVVPFISYIREMVGKQIPIAVVNKQKFVRNDIDMFCMSATEWFTEHMLAWLGQYINTPDQEKGGNDEA